MKQTNLQFDRELTAQFEGPCLTAFVAIWALYGLAIAGLCELAAGMLAGYAGFGASELLARD